MNSGPTRGTHIDQRQRLIDFLVFFIPLLRPVEVHLVGRLNGADILLFLVFIGLISARKIKVDSSDTRRFLALGLLWLLSQIVTDVVRGSAFVDYARGWSNIRLTLVNFAVFSSLLYGQTRRLTLYGLGLAAGTALTVLLNPDETMMTDPWKFGYGFTVSWTVLLIGSSERFRGTTAIILTGLIGILSFAIGSRSLGGFCLATASYLLMQVVMRRRALKGRKFGTITKFAIVALMMVAVAGVYWGYSFAASSGMLGEDAQQKFEWQSGGRFGLLLGGRTEVLGSIPAIYASPILGHGSWAKDPAYLLLERQTLAILGYDNAEDVSLEDVEEGVIPTHSHLFGAWVDAGILGAIFWMWVFAVAIRMLFRVHRSDAPLLPFATFAAMSLLWDIPFSPFGNEMRIISPFYVIAIMSCLSMEEQKLTSRDLRKLGSKIRRPQLLAPGKQLMPTQVARG